MNPLFILFVADKSEESKAKELELIRQIADKDQQALAELYDLYRTFLFGLIIKIVKKREESEEVLQEVFVQIWEKASTFDYQKGNVYVWLVTLTRNKAIDKIRSKSYRNNNLNSDIDDYSMYLEAESVNGLSYTIHNERSKFVQEALNQIPAEQRELLELAYFEGYSQSDLAEKLNLPLGTVKTRMRSGMKKLQSIVIEDYKND
ncbi:MAG: sigma-70 family RNA polymerase sigma factor [Calditrichaeota bacterium]|nr:sigma-70 family RNA polymerase sigma factor [Calditrichota bacterium]